MKLEKKKLTELKPLKENVRKHNEAQINELIRSVNQFGQTRAIVIDEDDNILIGNGLYEAMLKMDLEEAECFRKTGLSDIEKKKLVLTDNKVYSLGRDDYDGINNYIASITNAGDFDIAGFDTYTLEMMTISDEDNENLMNDYGKVEKAKYVEPVLDNHVKTSQETLLTKHKENEVEEQEKEVINNTTTNDLKSIICSSCGEVIYLD